MTLATDAQAPTTIVFGTDGWRARIADEFTFDNVRRCADGVAQYRQAFDARRGGFGGAVEASRARSAGRTCIRVGSQSAENHVRAQIAARHARLPLC